MPVRRPRQPRRYKPLTGANAQAYARSAQAGWDFAAKLEAIGEARKRQQAAPPIHVPRPSPSENRARRMPTAAELFAHTAANPTAPPVTEPVQGELFPAEWNDAGAQLPLWADEPLGQTEGLHRMPTAQELLDGTWDNGTAASQSPTSTEYYSPTASIYPPRPRTLEMSYDRQTRILRVVFRDGGTYDYFDVPGNVWYRIRQVKSPGRFIDRNIKGSFEFEKVAF